MPGSSGEFVVTGSLLLRVSQGSAAVLGICISNELFVGVAAASPLWSEIAQVQFLGNV